MTPEAPGRGGASPAPHAPSSRSGAAGVPHAGRVSAFPGLQTGDPRLRPRGSPVGPVRPRRGAERRRGACPGRAPSLPPAPRRGGPSGGHVAAGAAAAVTVSERANRDPGSSQGESPSLAPAANRRAICKSRPHREAVGQWKGRGAGRRRPVGRRGGQRGPMRRRGGRGAPRGRGHANLV